MSGFSYSKVPRVTETTCSASFAPSAGLTGVALIRSTTSSRSTSSSSIRGGRRVGTVIAWFSMS